MKKHLLIMASLTTVVLLGMLLGTDPSNLSAFFLIVPFILLLIIVWILGYAQLRAMGMSKLRSVRLAVLIAGLPVGLLLLQSIGQLTTRDIITILAFFGLAYFYIARITAVSE